MSVIFGDISDLWLLNYDRDIWNPALGATVVSSMTVGTSITSPTLTIAVYGTPPQDITTPTQITSPALTRTRELAIDDIYAPTQLTTSAVTLFNLADLTIDAIYAPTTITSPTVSFLKSLTTADVTSASSITTSLTKISQPLTVSNISALAAVDDVTVTAYTGADSVFTIDYGQSAIRTHHTLVWADNLAEGRGGWYADSYTPGLTLHYGEEGITSPALLGGGNDGAVYQFSGAVDSGVSIGCHIRTRTDDQGDIRLQKRYGDVWLDADTKGTNVKVKMGYNNYNTVGIGRVLNTNPRSHYPIDPDSRAWVVARNVCADILWRSANSEIRFYTWSPRWHEESASLKAKSWVISETDFGLDNFVYSGYIYIPHVSTADLTLTFTIDGTEQAGISITNSGGTFAKTFQRLPVMKGKLWKLKVASTEQFRIAGDQGELLIKEWGKGGQWLRIPLFKDIATSEVAQ